MNRIIILNIIFLMGAQCLWGQIFDFHIPLADSTGHHIKLYSENYMSAKRIKNSFQNKLLFGGEISQKQIDATSDRLNNKNAFGAYSYSGIEYIDYESNLFGVERLGYSVRLEEQFYTYGNIPGDLFDLTFKGNKGDSIFTMDEARFTSAHYQSIGWGIVDKKYGSNFNLSFVHGTNFRDLNVQEAKLSNYNGDSLSLNFDGTYEASDTARKQFFSGNGFGVNLDFELVLPITITRRDSSEFQWFFSLSVDNFGFISWNQRSVQYGQDSTYRFSGFQVDNLSFPNVSNSSLSDTLSLKTGKEKKITWLPARIWIRKMINHRSERKVQSIFGVGFWSVVQFTPMAYAGVYYNPAPWWAGSLNVSYGGFGSFRLGFRSDFYINDNFHILLSSNDMIGMISQNGYGRSFNFGLQWHI